MKVKKNNFIIPISGVLNGEELMFSEDSNATRPFKLKSYASGRGIKR